MLNELTLKADSETGIILHANFEGNAGCLKLHAQIACSFLGRGERGKIVMGLLERSIII